MFKLINWFWFYGLFNRLFLYLFSIKLKNVCLKYIVFVRGRLWTLMR